MAAFLRRRLFAVIPLVLLTTSLVFSLILLLPGVCALVFGAMSLSSPSSAAGIMPFVMVGLLVGFGGLALVVSAIRGRQR